METVALFIENQRERQVIQIICESYGFNTLPLPVESASFNQLLQFRPQTIIMEIPENPQGNISFLKQVYSESRMSKIRTLCFGDILNNETVRKITEIGRISYYGRPMTTDKIRQVIRPKNSSGSDLRKETAEQYEGESTDTEKIMSPDTSRAERISIMVDKIGELLAFPFTVAKVLAVTQSSTTGASDLARAIEIDPVIVSAILKTANSALYGKVGSKISSIKDAIVRIGFTETKAIAVSLSIMMLFSDEENSVGFDRQAFWYHSLATGIIAGKLARQAGYQRYEIAFVGGLLHDFGIILMDEFYPTFFTNTLRSATQNGVSFVEEQQNRWKMTHNDVVCRLFEKWNMPEELLAPLQFWLKDFSWKHETDKNMTTLVQSIRVAEIMAHSLSVGKECDESIEGIPSELAGLLKLNRASETAFFKSVNDEINIFTTYLQMDKIELAYSRDIPKTDRNATINYIDLAALQFDPLEYYLISHNYQLTYKVTAEEITESKTLPDALLIRVSEKTLASEIESFLSLYKAEMVGFENDSATCIPVLLCGPSKSAKEFCQLPLHCGYLSDSLDLRMLTFSLQRLMLGESLELRHEIPKQNVPVHVESQPTKEIATEKEVSKPAIATRIINNHMLFMVSGTLTLNFLAEIKDLIGKILQKADIILLDFSKAHCDGGLIQKLDEFRKLIWTKKIILVLCTMGTSENQHDELHPFATDEDLINHLHRLESQRKSEMSATGHH